MWKRIPPALLAGLGISIVFGVARVVHYLQAATNATAVTRFDLLEAGFDFAAAVLVVFGALELAHRLRGRAATGARIVAVAYVVKLVMFGLWLAVAVLVQHRDGGGELVIKIVRLLQNAEAMVAIAIAIGFGIASGSIAFTIGFATFAVVGVPLPALGAAMWNGSGTTYRAMLVIRLLPYAIMAAGALVASALAARQAAPPEVTSAERPFEQASRALWVRVLAAVTLAGLSVFAHDAAMLKLVTIVGPLIDCLALLGFAWAAMGLARANISRWLAIVAGAGALWSVGVTLSKLPHAYVIAYGNGGGFDGMFGPDASLEVASAYATTVPLIASLSIGLVLIAITRLARARNLDDLRENASVRTGVFVVLALGSLFIAHYGVEKLAIGSGGSRSMFMLAVLGAAGAAIYALVIAAKLCAEASAVVAHDPAGLPAAKLIKESSR